MDWSAGPHVYDVAVPARGEPEETEHEIGLACEVVGTDPEIRSLFDNQPVAAWSYAAQDRHPDCVVTHHRHANRADTLLLRLGDGREIQLEFPAGWVKDGGRYQERRKPPSAVADGTVKTLSARLSSRGTKT